MSALATGLAFILRLASHPAVQSALRKAVIAAGRELIRHATSSRASEKVNKVRTDRA